MADYKVWVIVTRESGYEVLVTGVVDEESAKEYAEDAVFFTDPPKGVTAVVVDEEDGETIAVRIDEVTKQEEVQA